MEEDGGSGGGKKRIRNTLILARSLTAKEEELNERRVGRGDRNKGESKQMRVSTN